jgi:hypothetical protein
MFLYLGKERKKKKDKDVVLPRIFGSDIPGSLYQLHTYTSLLGNQNTYTTTTFQIQANSSTLHPINGNRISE